MNTIVLILEVVVVLVFLVMFLRGSRLVWGIGLVTVTTAVLLDTFLGTFGRSEMIDQLGFFFFVIAGALFAGAAVWLWGLLRPLTSTVSQAPDRPPAPERSRPDHPQPSWAPEMGEAEAVTYDRRMLSEQIHQRLAPDDVLDLIFDLGLNENELVGWQQTSAELIVRVMDAAEARGQTGNLALAVERIVTPVPAERLPRPEKLTTDSPPTVIRHFLLAHYDETALASLADDLGVDWEEMAGTGKKARVRNFLLYLYRRERIDALVALLQQQA